PKGSLNVQERSKAWEIGWHVQRLSPGEEAFSDGVVFIHGAKAGAYQFSAQIIADDLPSPMLITIPVNVRVVAFNPDPKEFLNFLATIRAHDEHRHYGHY
ncbi:MAG: hypothetical protein JWM16_4206, partial [Verrucomicrobiales bacterium]|nr:hypothetical protein [Verrucomicrobiales bacterium]